MELNGEGFKRIAREGQQVKVGDPVMALDLALLRGKARSTITPVVISSMKEVRQLDKSDGEVEAGVDQLMTALMVLYP